ncbi:hypothetical protein EDM22_12325 [Agromyces tardus]|uniref:Uncharacterized protein n=1 Tax=Agromyces tardus TaxID=2583849 RepID=A0A3M8A864_9MICO|nr:hypothetical protein [Agromyces tardus]RNB47410.1 hypothetical protein EDM22_12325 [Agromyces tardus]
MASRKHLVAVNRQIVASGLSERGEHAALVDLARNLARRMDSAGEGDPPISVVNAYQSAVGRLTRVAAAQGSAKPRRATGDESVREQPPNKLEAFMRRWRVRPEDRARPRSEEDRASVERADAEV